MCETNFSFGNSANVEGGAAGAVEGEYRPRGGYRGTGYRGGRGTGERGGYRGTGERGAYRGGRGGKREFDRQSGSDKSGVKPQVILASYDVTACRSNWSRLRLGFEPKLILKKRLPRHGRISK